MYFLFFIFFKFFYNNSGIKPEFRISSPVIPKIRNSVFYKKMDSLAQMVNEPGLNKKLGSFIKRAEFIQCNESKTYICENVI